MKYASFSKNANTIAVSKNPFAVVFSYDTGGHPQGEVFSTHSSYDAARKASRKSGYDSFLVIRDAREYAERKKNSIKPSRAAVENSLFDKIARKNPIDKTAAARDKLAGEVVVEIGKAIRQIEREKKPLTRQAAASYAQGYIDAARKCGALSAAGHAQWMRALSMIVGEFV